MSTKSSRFVNFMMVAVTVAALAVLVLLFLGFFSSKPEESEPAVPKFSSISVCPPEHGTFSVYFGNAVTDRNTSEWEFLTDVSIAMALDKNSLNENVTVIQGAQIIWSDTVSKEQSVKVSLNLGENDFSCYLGLDASAYNPDGTLNWTARDSWVYADMVEFTVTHQLTIPNVILANYGSVEFAFAEIGLAIEGTVAEETAHFGGAILRATAHYKNPDGTAGTLIGEFNQDGKTPLLVPVDAGYDDIIVVCSYVDFDYEGDPTSTTTTTHYFIPSVTFPFFDPSVSGSDLPPASSTDAPSASDSDAPSVPGPGAPPVSDSEVTTTPTADSETDPTSDPTSETEPGATDPTAESTDNSSPEAVATTSTESHQNPTPGGED